MGLFDKKTDITGAGSSVNTREMAPALNHEVELEARANSFANPVFPTAGTLTLGDVGMEFRADTGVGYVQIPWRSVEKVVVDIPTKGYVHAITVHTDEAAPLQFVISDGANVLRAINRHVGRDRLERGPQNFKNAAVTVKDKVTGIFKKKDKGGDGAGA